MPSITMPDERVPSPDDAGAGDVDDDGADRVGDAPYLGGGGLLVTGSSEQPVNTDIAIRLLRMAHP
jgi:hypothetical protein